MVERIELPEAITPALSSAGGTLNLQCGHGQWCPPGGYASLYRLRQKGELKMIENEPAT